MKAQLRLQAISGTRMPGDGVWRVLVALYLGALLSANAMAAKLIDVFGLAAVTVGALAIPIVYSVTDLLNELYGKRNTRSVVWMGFIANVLFAGLTLVFRRLPAAPIGASQEAFDAVFASAPRVVLGSQLAYLVSSMVDVEVFSLVRARTGPDKLWLRQTAAVLISQLVDSWLFTVVAFAGVLPTQALPVLAFTEYATKIAVSPLRTGVSYLLLRRIR